MCAESCETHVLDLRPNLVATLQHLVKFSELAGGWEPQNNSTRIENRNITRNEAKPGFDMVWLRLGESPFLGDKFR